MTNLEREIRDHDKDDTSGMQQDISIEPSIHQEERISNKRINFEDSSRMSSSSNIGNYAPVVGNDAMLMTLETESEADKHPETTSLPVKPVPMVGR